MVLELYEKPKNVTIIEGFPGFGLVGSITTEFLVDHLNAKLIGKIFLPKQPAIATIHQSKVIYPMSVFYSKDKKLIILEGLYVVHGGEWEIADNILELARITKAKEIISLEGVHLPNSDPLDNLLTTNDKKIKEIGLFYFTKDAKKISLLKEKGYKPINEGVVMGVSGSLLLKNNEFPHCCLFAEARTEYPDSAASAKLIEGLNYLINLNLDYKPLLKSAQKFEEKLKSLVKNAIKAKEDNDKKDMSYVG